MAQNESSTELPQVARKPFTRRRAITLLLLVLLITFATQTYLKIQSQHQAQAYLESRGFKFRISQKGFAWYRELTAQYPLPKIQHVTGAGHSGLWPKQGDGDSLTSLQPKDWAALKQFPNMIGLDLYHCALTDDQLTHFQAFPKLVELNLVGNPITGQGFKHFPPLKNLGVLMLNKTQLTDANLKYLAPLPLYMLGLSETPITDAGLQHLTALNQLKYLGLIKTNTTLEHATQLLPGVQISHTSASRKVQP